MTPGLVSLEITVGKDVLRIYAKNSTVKQISAKLCNHEENCKFSSKESVIINILLLFKALENDIRIFKMRKSL